MGICTYLLQHVVLLVLFCFYPQSWESAPDRYREKLLELIGKIGKDDRQGKTATKVIFTGLYVLWLS